MFFQVSQNVLTWTKARGGRFLLPSAELLSTVTRWDDWCTVTSTERPATTSYLAFTLGLSFSTGYKYLRNQSW